MVALTQDRNTATRPGADVVDPMAANVTIYMGAIVVLNAAGNADRGTTAVGLIARGIAQETKTNGANVGENSIRSFPAIARLANLAADAVTRAEIGDDCFIVDDQTVAKTNGGNTRSVAGKVIDLDAQGVWVRVGI